MKSAPPVFSPGRTLSLVRLGVPVALIVLSVGVGVPLFLRSPLWCDITLYDMAAKNVLAGGVHYRDLFDTNTPGFVWMLAGIRAAVGWSSESLLAVDLLFVLGTTLTLCRLAKLAGASVRNRLWLAAGCAAFYLFSHEMIHAQRDVWLSLPALLAVLLRLMRITRPKADTFSGVFLPAMAEGALWALAVWIKPHFLLVAAGWWLFTVPRLAGSRTVGRSWWAWPVVVLADLGGCLLAGGLIGAAGVWYMVASGTWAAFLEVMTVWNVGYLEGTLHGIHTRWTVFTWFPPWNFLAPLAVVFALFGMIDARVWAGRFRSPERGGLLHPITFRGVWFKGGTDEQRYARAGLGAVYVLWLLQAIVLQRPYEYIHAAEVMIGLAVWAAFRWNAAALIAGWLLVVQVAWVVAEKPLAALASENAFVREVCTPHAVFNRERTGKWGDCFRPLDDADRYRLQDSLRREAVHPASISWAELHEVADYLRTRKVGDDQLVCWHDSPHALYLMLDVKPGLRFMHVNTARMISWDCDGRVCDEFRQNTDKRFAVIDLQRFAFVEWMDWKPGGVRPYPLTAYAEPGAAKDDLLPPAAAWLRDGPWLLPNEPELPFELTKRNVVFRSGGRGRYVVVQLKE